MCCKSESMLPACPGPDISNQAVPSRRPPWYLLRTSSVHVSLLLSACIPHVTHHSSTIYQLGGREEERDEGTTPLELEAGPGPDLFYLLRAGFLESPCYIAQGRGHPRSKRPGALEHLPRDLASWEIKPKPAVFTMVLLNGKVTYIPSRKSPKNSKSKEHF